jgi:glutathione synthase/RimK-type ligase-like ATP-grasp enzyme
VNILIIAIADDPHTEAVRWGLRQLGCVPVVWYWADFPRSDISSLEMGANGEVSASITIDGVTHAAPFDVVWMRRQGTPSPMARCHPDDAAVVEREAAEYLRNIVPFLGDRHTRWINDPLADWECAPKMHQLRVAAQLGFTIPDTIIGNDPARIAAFYEAHDRRVVHKSQRPAMWENEDGSHTVARTSPISARHIASEYALRGCPAIYQPLIAKKYELRVTVIGGSVIGAAIDSQRDGATVDWRYEGGRGDTNTRAIALDAALAARCLALCRQLNLAFGCIDLVVGTDDQVYFLEINNVGQFLWKELADPSLPMLDTFCRYLMDASYTACADTVAQLRLADFVAPDAARGVAQECTAG